MRYILIHNNLPNKHQLSKVLWAIETEIPSVIYLRKMLLSKRFITVKLRVALIEHPSLKLTNQVNYLRSLALEQTPILIISLRILQIKRLKAYLTRHSLKLWILIPDSIVIITTTWIKLSKVMLINSISLIYWDKRSTSKALTSMILLQTIVHNSHLQTIH